MKLKFGVNIMSGPKCVLFGYQDKELWNILEHKYLISVACKCLPLKLMELMIINDGGLDDFSHVGALWMIYAMILTIYGVSHISTV